MVTIKEAREVAALIRDAGGEIVGGMRVQRIAYVLETAGLGSGFYFGHKPSGPYSESLRDAMRRARVARLIREVERPTDWGGFYSTFSTDMPEDPEVNPTRRALVREMNSAGIVELVLAAAALFFHLEKIPDPWAITERRKPAESEEGRLEGAKVLYRRIRMKAPELLPEF